MSKCARCAKFPEREKAHYVRLWLNGSDITRYADRVPDGTWSWQWVVCSACLCVSRVPRCTQHDGCGPAPKCQAPPSAEVEMVRTRRIKRADGKRVHMQCGEAVWLEDLAPRLNATLETIFLLKGLPPVLGVLDTLGPVEIGLDDPGGAPHDWELYKSRPKSIKRKYKRRKPAV